MRQFKRRHAKVTPRVNWDQKCTKLKKIPISSPEIAKNVTHVAMSDVACVAHLCDYHRE